MATDGYTEGRDIYKYFGYFVKTATRVVSSSSIFSGCIGDDFEGQFAPEGYEVTPETDEHVPIVG